MLLIRSSSGLFQRLIAAVARYYTTTRGDSPAWQLCGKIVLRRAGSVKP